MNTPNPRSVSRRRHVLLVLAIVPVSLLVMAGCGHLRHDSTSIRRPVTTAAPTPAASGVSTTTAAPAPGADTQTLDSIDQQLSGVGSDINSVGGQISTADSALNSQEGDPSK